MRSAVICFLITIVISSTAVAQAPDSMSFQGVLTDSNGVTVTNGNYNLLLRMYKGSSKVWEQNHIGVPVKAGVFNLILSGTTTYPLDTVAFNAPVDLGVTVNGGAEMTPRTPLTSAAYARALPGLYTFYNDAGTRQGYNVVGGAPNNVVGAGVTGATIGGGGGIKEGTPRPNQVLREWGTVAGGYENTASGRGSVVSGGFENTANNPHATVAGGWENTADGFGAVVGGGEHNTASADYATVPGGTFNSAQGQDSFAAGRRAKAIHSNSFVWSDGLGDLLTTGTKQFLIRAAGGVGIGTNAPLYNSKLHVEHGSVGTNDWGVVVTNSTHQDHHLGMRLSNIGFVEITNNADNDGPDFARLASDGNWSAVSDRRLKTGIEPASGLLEAALELEPVRYYFKNQEDRGEKSLGLIAQDVQEVVPSLVIDGDPMTLNYAGMSVVAIGAIQELYELVQEQQNLLSGQQAEIERMRTVMERAGLQ